MPDYVVFLLVGLVVFITHYQEGITGFGCTVLAVPFVTMLVGLDMAVPMLVIIGTLIAIGIVLMDRRGVAWGEYGIIVVLMMIGVPIGLKASSLLPETTLRWVLAGFMVVVGIHGIIKQGLKYSAPEKMSRTKRALLSLFVPIGGVMQGAFGSGGPLLVIYATRAMPNKSVFRGTLCIVWITLNSIIIGTWVKNGVITGEILRLTAIALPFMLAGMFLGNRAHYRVNEVAFRRIVYGVLILSGIVLITQLLKHP